MHSLAHRSLTRVVAAMLAGSLAVGPLGLGRAASTASTTARNGVRIVELELHGDGARTPEQAETSESALVAAVLAEIRHAGLTAQVVLHAGSPSILRHAYQQAPEMPRILSLDFLQLVPPPVAEQVLGVPVRRIPRTDCGLTWYEVGDFARLPSYFCASDPESSITSFVATALGCAHATAVSVDKAVLLLAGPAARTLVASLHAAGLQVVVGTMESANEWRAAAGAGGDGITTIDSVLEHEHQAARTALAASANAKGATGRETDRSGDRPAPEPSPGCSRDRHEHAKAMVVR